MEHCSDIMSDNYGDNNATLTVEAQISTTMGNLFSKEEEDLQESHSELDDTVVRHPSSPTFLPDSQDEIYSLLDKAAAQESLIGEVNEPQVLQSEAILNAFLNEVRNAKPASLRNWSALQHYIYFIYRHVISAKPCNSNEIFPNIITKKIRDLLESLLQEDISQLCIRLVTLGREYAIIARGHFDSLQHPKITTYLVSLMSYYSAFCSAASKLAPLLPEFDFLIMERFNVNWLCLNKSIFYHYVYMSPAVQSKLPLFLKLKEENKSMHKNLLESYACFSEDMSLIATRWATLRMRISNLSRKRALSNPSKHLLNDWKMFEEHKKILKTNYWLVRNVQAIQIQDMAELDAHILSLVGDTAHIADFLIDSEGHCMCEDCLAAEFRSSSVTTVIPSSFQAQSAAMCRLITCYICQDPIALDALASHIVMKHHDNGTQKSSRIYLTPHQKRFPKKSSKNDLLKCREQYPFESLFDKNLELKESILKLVNRRFSKNDIENESSDKTDCLRPKKKRLPSLNNPKTQVDPEEDEAIEQTSIEEVQKQASERLSAVEGDFKLKTNIFPLINTKETSISNNDELIQQKCCFGSLISDSEEAASGDVEVKKKLFLLSHEKEVLINNSEELGKILAQQKKKKRLFPSPPRYNSVSEPEELKHKPVSTSRMSETSYASRPPTSPIFQTPNDNLKNKEPVFKIASEAPVMQNVTEMFKGASKSNEDTESCKTAFEEFLKQQNLGDIPATPNGLTDSLKWKSTDVANKKAVEVLKKSAEIFSNKDVLKNAGDINGKKPFITLASGNTYIHNSPEDAFRKPQQKSVNGTILVNNPSKSVPNGTVKPDSCLGHACGHKCKQEDAKQQPPEIKKHSCQDTCDYHKESRKCDCAYCEVFGASLPPHTHKTNETRDRLRTRLNQRKEKVNENIIKPNGKTSPLAARLGAKSNGGSNCAVKLCGSSKVHAIRKSINVNASSNAVVTPKPNETESRGSRVHEVVQPVPPPVNIKPVSIAEARTPLGNIQNPISPRIVSNSKLPTNGPTERLVSESQPSRSSPSLSISSLNSENVGYPDINQLLNFIEGTKTVDKAILAQKKAAKKARQKEKKAQEREQIELEKRLKEEARFREERRKEEERIKAEALARHLIEKQKKNKKMQNDNKVQQKHDGKKGKKKGKNNENSSAKENSKDSNLIEETIPAMVTIKRVADGANSPATVTITLKGSTPESDKLLFTLVNGHANREQLATATINAEKLTKAHNESVTNANSQVTTSKNGNSKSNKKKKRKEKEREVNEVTSQEVKVTIAVDKNNVKKANKKSGKSNENSKVPEAKANKNFKDDKQVQNKTANNIREDINLPMLRLPPGITITKIEGPPANRNCKVSSNSTAANQNSNVPVSKSGVIVVDTEKLIQQSITASNNKKNKKKNKKKQAKNLESDGSNNGVANDGSSMVTLKNPIFHSLQNALNSKVGENGDIPVFPGNQQASIFKNENGMVTIRSPRLQNTYENGSPISNFLSDLKPMFSPEVSTPYVPMCHSNFTDGSKTTTFNAQEILSGLPGIEITKVDKNVSKNDSENKKSSQAAEVSIIPTNNTNNAMDKFNFDKDDWPFESVFTPRDVLEEDMDAEERELEAFKRFCQQSVPPERKEKVAHLNVKDIILNKKRDVTYS